MSLRPAKSDDAKQAFSVAKGSVVIKGYPLARGLWQLSWYAADGLRKRKAFADESEARKFAARKAAELSGQRSHVRSLTSEETEDYETAIAKLPKGVTLTTAVNFYLSRHRDGAPRLTVKQAVDELLADLKARELSPAYQRTAAVNLNRFAEDFACCIADVSADLFRTWLRGLGVAAKTQKGIRGLVVKLFNFSATKRLVSRELAMEIAEVEAPKAIITEIHTLSPDELRRFLLAAAGDELPSLALLAFLPVRTAEVSRLDWRDLRLGERVLIVNAGVAKVSVRRVVPVPAACVAWLTGHVKRSGKIAPDQPDPDGNILAHRLPVIAQSAGITYRKNCLRHSVISALMATEQDAARVSLWAGNSPRIVQTNYSARWTKAEGEAWFAVLPETPANVIQGPCPAPLAEATG